MRQGTGLPRGSALILSTILALWTIPASAGPAGAAIPPNRNASPPSTATAGTASGSLSPVAAPVASAPPAPTRASTPTRPGSRSVTPTRSVHGKAPAVATGAWSGVGSLATARSYHTATLLPSGQVLVSGGDGASGPLNSAELYDPTTGTWGATGSMATPRARPVR